MSGSRKKKLVTIILIICVSGSLLFFPIIFSLFDYLSKTEKVEANLLIIEGWLPSYAIEMAYDEFKDNHYDLIITTGIKISEYYQVYTNGYLIFYTNQKLKENDKSGDHTIEIEAYSELGEKNCAHFNVFINDAKVADFLADKKKRKYEITWNGKLSNIDSVIVQFDNDMVNEYGDRNLYVKDIIFNHNTKIVYQNNSEYDIGILDGKRRVINNFNSFAELARNRILSMGIDSSLILAITGNRVKLNRTLTSALAFRDWLNTSNIKVEGINIVTVGAHAKRTWMTYNKILKGTYQIGIISLPDYKNNYSKKKKIFKTLRETIGIMYYWIILIPY